MSEKLGFYVDIVSIVVGFWPVMFLAVLQAIPNRKRKQMLWQWIGKIFRNLTKTLLLFALMWFVVLLFGEQPVFFIPEPQNSLLFWSLGGIVIFFWTLSLGFYWLKRSSEFEELVAESFRRLEHKFKVVGNSGDHCVDIRVRASNGEKWVV